MTLGEVQHKPRLAELFDGFQCFRPGFPPGLSHDDRIINVDNYGEVVRGLYGELKGSLEIGRCPFQTKRHHIPAIDAVLRDKDGSCPSLLGQWYIMEPSFDVHGSKHPAPTQRVYHLLAILEGP